MNFNDQKVFGFDVSMYQDDNTTPQQIDFVKMKAYGAAFVIIRAGQNLWVDPDFMHNWRAAREAGLPRAPYWFFDPRVSPYEQARIFSNLFADDKPEGRLWLDLEFPPGWGGEYADWRNWKIFIEEVKRRTGLRVGIYTAQWWWYPNAVQKGADVAYFGQYPLWVAQYTTEPSDVILPKGWTKCPIWQDGTPAIGKLAGVESEEIDHNKWNSDFDFKAEWGLQATTPPPIETGEPMYGKVLVNLNIRKTPGTTYAPIGQLAPNDVIEASINTSGWWKLTKITRGQQEIPLPALDCYAYEGASNGYIQPIAPVPAEDRPVKVTVEMESGKVYVSEQLTEQA